MLKEKAKEYYNDKDYNCAEAIIRAANDVYDLGINEAGLKSYGCFGAGMQCGSVCGAVSWAMGAISAKEVKSIALESETLGPKCREMMKGLRNVLGTLYVKRYARINFPKKRGAGKLWRVRLKYWSRSWKNNGKGNGVDHSFFTCNIVHGKTDL